MTSTVNTDKCSFICFLQVELHYYTRHLLLPFTVFFLWGSQKLLLFSDISNSASLRLLQTTIGWLGILRHQSQSLFIFFWPNHKFINRRKLSHILNTLKDTKKIITAPPTSCCLQIHFHQKDQTNYHPFSTPKNKTKQKNKLLRESVGEELSWFWNSRDWEKENDPNGKVGGVKLSRPRKGC